jgi:metallophosphoesterase (TIGR00282 family)
LRVLFIGDIVGRPGRRLIHDLLPGLRREYAPDFIIANGENAAAGYGITQSTAQELFDAGVDCLTMGNHVWAQREAQQLLDRENRIVRPLNYPPGVPGTGVAVYDAGGAGSIGVINLLGRVFMDPVDCPFRAAAEAVGRLAGQCDCIIVDMHAEATSEKAALAHYLDGQVTAVLGTHTHVQTADEEIFAGGTAFISDAGMTGPRHTIIGVKPEIVVRRFLTGLPARFEVPTGGPAQMCGVVVDSEPRGVAATCVRRFRVLTDGPAEV